MRSFRLAFSMMRPDRTASSRSGESKWRAQYNASFASAVVFNSPARTLVAKASGKPRNCPQPLRRTAERTKSRSSMRSGVANHKAMVSCAIAAKITRASERTSQGASCKLIQEPSTTSSHFACSGSRRIKLTFAVLWSATKSQSASSSRSSVVPEIQRCSRHGIDEDSCNFALATRTNCAPSARMTHCCPDKALTVSATDI
mmetsp:Transcript_112619/g.325403  ORF Transcript_112619/g.325403 Transcript_112619/m.325403 type:complete len:201 (-) Transcript_112619:51-653(-)